MSASRVLPGQSFLSCLSPDQQQLLTPTPPRLQPSTPFPCGCRSGVIEGYGYMSCARLVGYDGIHPGPHEDILWGWEWNGAAVPTCRSCYREARSSDDPMEVDQDGRPLLVCACYP